jgi:exosortase
MRKHFVSLAFLLIVSIVMWRNAIASLIRLARSNDAYTYTLLIVPLSLALIWLQWERVELTCVTNLKIGMPVLATATLIVAITRLIPSLASETGLSLRILALVMWWLGSVIACFGIGIIRSVLFPFGLIFLTIPLPQRILDFVIQFLQERSATAATLIFHAFGVPVAKDGLILSIPGLDIQVARQCSSIRSSQMLVIVAIIFAALFLRQWWSRTLLVAVAIPLSIAKNGLRIFVITELGTRVNPEYLGGRLHENGGVVFFLIAVVVMSLFLAAMRQSERDWLRGLSKAIYNR